MNLNILFDFFFYVSQTFRRKQLIFNQKAVRWKRIWKTTWKVLSKSIEMLVPLLITVTIYWEFVTCDSYSHRLQCYFNTNNNSIVLSLEQMRIMRKEIGWCIRLIFPEHIVVLPLHPSHACVYMCMCISTSQKNCKHFQRYPKRTSNISFQTFWYQRYLIL